LVGAKKIVDQRNRRSRVHAADSERLPLMHARLAFHRDENIHRLSTATIFLDSRDAIAHFLCMCVLHPVGSV
jgi:hypothetical protein